MKDLERLEQTADPLKADGGLAADAARYRDLCENAVVGMFHTTISGEIAWVNRAAAELLGYDSPEDVLREVVNIRDLYIDPHKRDEFVRLVSEQGSISAFEYEIRRRDGTHRWICVDARTLIGRGGKIVGFEGTVADITAPKTENIALHEERARLSELERMKNDFVAMVAHDLRSPIAVMVGMTEILVTNWSRFEEDKKQSLLVMMLRNAKRASDLVEEVLQVASIESADFRCDIAPFDLVEIASSVVEDALAAETEHDVRLYVGEDVGLALGDGRRNWQVISNLLSNANRFSPPGEVVEVAVTASNGTIRVSVDDHGPGIAPEDRGRIFDKFTRLPLAGAMQPSGAGLGLYICKSLVEAQGGRIWVEGEPGEGARFVYELPSAA